MQLVKIKTAAEALGISSNTLRRATKEGRIPFTKVGNRYLYDVELVKAELQREMLDRRENQLRAALEAE